MPTLLWLRGREECRSSYGQGMIRRRKSSRLHSINYSFFLMCDNCINVYNTCLYHYEQKLKQRCSRFLIFDFITLSSSSKLQYSRFADETRCCGKSWLTRSPKLSCSFISLGCLGSAVEKRKRESTRWGEKLREVKKALAKWPAGGTGGWFVGLFLFSSCTYR